MANILYRGSGTPTLVNTAGGKNAALTNLEIDQNFFALDRDKLETGGGTITGALTVNGGITSSLSGNASTATTLQTARTINGVSFNGSANISFGTDAVSEGTSNLYFTNARARTALSATGSLSYNSTTGVFSYTQGNTDTVAEGASNLYFTTARARSSISTSGSLSYSSATGVISYTAPTSLPASDVYSWAKAQNKPSYSSNEITENTNLYYTDLRARFAISVVGSLSYNNSTGVISYYTPVSLPASDVYSWAKAQNKPSYNSGEISELTNLYYTDTRARAAISASGSLSYNNSTGVISYTAPTSLPASDVYSWAKQPSKPTYTRTEVGLGNSDTPQFAGLSILVPGSYGALNFYGNSGSGYSYIANLGGGTNQVLGFYNSTTGELGWFDNSGNMSVTGNLTAKGNVTAQSDARLKTNVKTIENALDTTLKLRGVTFDRNNEAGLGVIAQEVQAVIPQVVVEGSDENKTLSVAYGNIVGLLIEAIKELNIKVEDLQNQLANK